MHEYLATIREAVERSPDLFVGNVIQVAIDEGLQVETVQISDEPYLDIATADGLRKAVKGCPIRSGIDLWMFAFSGVRL